MLQTTQLRFVAIVLFAAAAASLTTASARAFSLGNGGTVGGGNAAFADPDEQVGKMFGLDQGGASSSLSSPAQFDRQPGKPNPYKHFHADSLTSPPDPLSRPSDWIGFWLFSALQCCRGFNLAAAAVLEPNKKLWREDRWVTAGILQCLFMALGGHRAMSDWLHFRGDLGSQSNVVVCDEIGGNYMKIAVLLGLLLCSVTALFPQSAEAQQDQNACMNDAFMFCGQFIPDRDRVAHCLMTNRRRVSPACRVALKSFK
jgi:hypothetical protein